MTIELNFFFFSVVRKSIEIACKESRMSMIDVVYEKNKFGTAMIIVVTFLNILTKWE